MNLTFNAPTTATRLRTRLPLLATAAVLALAALAAASIGHWPGGHRVASPRSAETYSTATAELAQTPELLLYLVASEEQAKLQEILIENMVSTEVLSGIEQPWRRTEVTVVNSTRQAENVPERVAQTAASGTLVQVIDLR